MGGLGGSAGTEEGLLVGRDSMSKNIRVVKGKVVVEGKFTSLEEEVVRARYRDRKVFEFWRTSHASLSFLKDLADVEGLSFVNAKIEDPSALSCLSSLKKLFLNGVRVSSGFGFLATLGQIEELYLLNLKGELVLPDLEGLGSLRKFRVWGCKRFSDASVLKGVRDLEEVEFVDAGMVPDDLLVLFEKASIKYINCRFGTKRHNDAFSEYLVKFGKKQYREP
ncbi:hypothetical protein WMF18_09710 [Sorangium sp. So ce315]|uniref:hypothetical protein n=1 Tax=Sorangium sp. So ce315 TaxID=3133299 RepID=UPI003F606858